MRISDSVLIIQSELNHQICLNSIYMQTYVTYQTNYMNSAFQSYHPVIVVEHLYSIKKVCM